MLARIRGASRAVAGLGSLQRSGSGVTSNSWSASSDGVVTWLGLGSTPKAQIALHGTKFFALAVVLRGQRIGRGLNELDRKTDGLTSPSVKNALLYPGLSPLTCSLKSCSRTYRSPVAVRRNHAYGLEEGITSDVHELDDFGEQTPALKESPQPRVVAQRRRRDTDVAGDISLTDVLGLMKMLHQPCQLARQEILVDVRLISQLVAPVVVHHVSRNRRESGWDPSSGAPRSPSAAWFRR